MVDLTQTFVARGDSSTANSAELTIKNNVQAPPIEISFGAKTGSGDANLEYNGGLPDPDTVVYVGDDLTPYDVIYVFSSTFLNSGPALDAGLGGVKVTVIEIVGYPTAGETTRWFFTPENPLGDPANEVTLGQLNSLGNGRLDLNELNTDDVCFLAGTLIMTPQGEKAVELLSPGDRVLTQDGKTEQVIWVSSSKVTWPAAANTRKPIEIAAGALGPNFPKQKLVVSPQHHVLLQGQVCRKLFGTDEVLAPAKGLTNLPGVRVMLGKKTADYVHIMLANHEIVIAEGLPTESFYPGPTAVRMLTPAQRASLFAVVPALRTDPENGYGPTARKKITRREAERLVAAILTDRKAKAVAAE